MLDVHYSFPGRLGVTGIGMTAWHQIDGLVRQGVRVHVHCGTLERPLEGLASLHESFRVFGARVPYRVLGNDRMFALHDRIVARSLQRASRADVVHGWPLGSARTLKAAKRLGVPTFLERPNAHTVYAYEAVDREVRRLGLSLPAGHSHFFSPKRVEREDIEYSLADHLLCPSDFVAKSFLDRGFPAGKLVRHQYGYDPARFRPIGRPERTGEGLRAIFVGSCEPRKGLHFALEAWVRSAAARDGRFDIFGRFIPEYRSHLEQWLAHPSVHAVGFTSDVPGAMQQADILLLPSIEEGSALVTYEARASGCVLVVSDATGAPCTHMHDGLVHAAGDVDTLEKQISALSSDPSLLARLRQASISGIDGLTWDAAARRLISVYRSI